MFNKIIPLFLLLLVFQLGEGLRCYICSTNENDDQTCVENPENVPSGVITCNKKYCSSARVEYLDPKDKVQSISRTCEDKPLFMNQIIEDSTYKIYYVACQKDFCNGGSGKDTTGDGIGDDDTGGFGTLLVPGKGGSQSLKSVIYLTIINIVFMCVLL